MPKKPSPTHAVMFHSFMNGKADIAVLEDAADSLEVLPAVFELNILSR